MPNEIKDFEISVLINGNYDPSLTSQALLSIRKHLPGAQVIFSTWENTDISEADRNLCDMIVFNKDPGMEYNDPQNETPNNIQRILKSVQAGLPYCRNKYILRLRSDLALTGTGFTKYFSRFQQRFPSLALFERKIIIGSLFTMSKIRQNGLIHPTPFHISDWYCFGLKQDVCELYHLPPIGRLKTYSRYFENRKRPNFKDMDCIKNRLWKFPVEQYIGVHNAKKVFKNLDFPNFLSHDQVNQKEAEKFIISNFIVLDTAQSDIHNLKPRYAGLNAKNVHPFLKKDLLSYKTYEKKYKQYFATGFFAPDKIASRDISVVVQGAVDRSYTLKCLKSIRKKLPAAEIILSTWEGTDVSYLDYDLVIFNKDPGAEIFTPNGRRQNQNRQILSTQNGIKAATRPYVLKIRTDMKILGTKFLTYFDKYGKRNPSCKILKKRVLINSLYTRNPESSKPFLFHPSDWMMFGLKEDMLNIWDIPLAPEPETSRYFVNHPELLNHFGCWTRWHAEQYIWMSFLKKNNIEFEFKHYFDYSEELKNLSELSIVNNTVLLEYLTQFDILCQKYPARYGDSETAHPFNWLLNYKHMCHAPEVNGLLVIEYMKNSKYLLKLKKHFTRVCKPLKILGHYLENVLSVFYYFCRWLIAFFLFCYHEILKDDGKKFKL